MIVSLQKYPLALPPGSNSDPGSHTYRSGRSSPSPLPPSARAFIYKAEKKRQVLPTLTRVEQCEFTLRLKLIGKRFFHNFQSLEVPGDMYQYTEAFCHCS